MCLPVQRRHAVDGLQAAAGRHHIEAVRTVTWHMEVVLWVTVLHDDDKPRPPVSQIVACHSFPTLRNKAPRKKHYHALTAFLVVMDLFLINRFLRRSRHSWLNIYSGEWETTSNIFLHYELCQIYLHDHRRFCNSNFKWKYKKISSLLSVTIYK